MTAPPSTTDNWFLPGESLEGGSIAAVTGSPPQADGYLAACWSASTRRAYAADLRDYVNWGGPFPGQPQDIAAYVTDRARVLRVSTLRRRLIGIGMAHTMVGLADPTRSALIRKLVRGIQRVHGVAQRRAMPIIEVDLQRMFPSALTPAQLRDRALMWVGFAAALRRSEIVALDVADLQFGARGLSVRLRRSKTDQYGRSRLIGIPDEAAGKQAIEAVHAWLAVRGLQDGPVFTRLLVSGKAGARLSDQSVNLLIKRHALAIGLPADRISGHSLRAGFVTSAVRAGASLVAIQRQTGHASLDMLARYIREIDPFICNAHAQMGITTKDLGQ